MKRFLCMLLAAVMLLSLAGCAKAPAAADADETPTWQTQYDLGVRYLSEGKYEEAILAFNAAIEIDPKNPDAYFGRAQAYLALDGSDSNRARDDLQTARGLGLDSNELHERLLESYEARGEADEASAERDLLYERTGLERYAPDPETAARRRAAALIAQAPDETLAYGALTLADAYATYWYLYSGGTEEPLDASDAGQMWQMIWNYEVSVRYRQGFDQATYGAHLGEGYLTDSARNILGFVNAIYQIECTLPPFPDGESWMWWYTDGLYCFGIGDRGAENVHLDTFQRTGSETAELTYHVNVGPELLCGVTVQLRANPHVDPDSETPFYYVLDSISIQPAETAAAPFTNEQLEQMTATFFQTNYPGNGGYVVFDSESEDGGDTLDVVVRFQWAEDSGVQTPNVYVADIRIDKQSGALLDLTTYETIGSLW